VVNKREIVKLEGAALEAEALRILRAIPGVSAERVERRGPDAVVRYAGVSAPIGIEFRKRVNASTAHRLLQSTHNRSDARLLVVAAETTAEAREILADGDVALVDGLGNVHIELPGLLVHLEGKPRPRAAVPTKLRGKAGLAAQALLLQANRIWRVADLAAEANISAGLAHRVLARLEHEGIVEAEGSGPKRTRQVVQPAALLDLWADEQADAIIWTPGYLLAQTAAQLVERVSGPLADADIPHALTGAAGASVLAPFVTAVPVAEVWVPADIDDIRLHQAAGTRNVAEGYNVMFLQENDDAPLAFRAKHHGVWVANVIRLYGDLLRDPKRGREQAAHLREEVIGF
jgi:hypothetical protein